MTDRLAGAGAVVMVDGKQVAVDRSTDLSSLSKDAVKALRDMGSLVKPDADPAESVEAPVHINVGASDIEAIAAHIKEQKLTGPETVALASDDPALARKVLEAEAVAQDNDPRANVKEPLEKIIG